MITELKTKLGSVDVFAFALCCDANVVKFVEKARKLKHHTSLDKLKLTLFCDGDASYKKDDFIVESFDGTGTKIGLTYNFIRAINFVMQFNFDYIMYMEDDIDFHPRFGQKIITGIETEADLISCYTCEWESCVPKYNDDLNEWVEWNAGECQTGTQCFIMKKNMFVDYKDQMSRIANLNPFRVIMDQFTFSFARNRMYKTVFHVPSLVTHLNWRLSGNTDPHYGFGVERWHTRYVT